MFIRIFTLFLLIKVSLFACAGEWDYNQKEFVFLENRDFPFSNVSEEVNSANVYNTIVWAYEDKNKKENLKEWKKELNDKFTLKEIEEIVYRRIDLYKIQDKEILDYINFVGNQEKQVTRNYYMSEDDKRRLIDEKILLNEALEKIDRVNSSWLKLRYFYLALRLAHYKQKEPLKIYEKYKYLLENDSKTIVKDWIQGLYAGALIKNGQTVNGVYEFSKLFSKDKINSHLSYYNFFHIKTDEQWKELLNLAKTNEEKTKFYALRALNENSSVLEELDNIYKLDKNSKWFDFVLFRELLNTQHTFDQNSEYLRDYPITAYINYLKTIKKDDMYLVNLSLAYFNLYEKKFEESSKITAELEKNYPNSHEVKTLSYILYLEKLDKIDTKIENEIYEKMTKLTKNEINSTSIRDYTFVILEKLYSKQNDKFNAFLAKYINHLDISYFDLELLEKFRIFMENPKDSKIKEYFASKYEQHKLLEKRNGKFVLSSNMLDTKTKLLINNLKFKEALDLNAFMLNEKIQFNPFNGLIKGNNRSGKEYTITVKEFLEKVIIIKNELEKNPNSAMDNYLYANALYNLSYFGNSNVLTVVYRSVSSFTDYDLQKEKLNLATKHYTIALNESKNEEFKAKITYMLAKIELSLFDIETSSKTKDYYNKDFDRYNLKRFWFYGNAKVYKEYINNNFGKYFDTLRKDYNNTSYYKELIRECTNLRIYEDYKLKKPKPSVQ